MKETDLICLEIFDTIILSIWGEEQRIMFDLGYPYFLAVAKTGSFRKAAENRCVSRPAIGRQMRFLCYIIFKNSRIAEKEIVNV